ncbi:MAG TPA: DUF2103 domain-containing protein [Herpetosiphonaceae bacterium]
MADKTRGLLKGPKFNGRHTTLIAAAVPVVELLRDDPRVTKIIIGVITPRRGKTTTLKAVTIDAGLKITIAAPRNVQELYAYTSDSAGVRSALEALPL